MTDAVDIVRRFYTALARGDVPGVLATLNDNVEWTEAERFPYYTGTWRGPDAVFRTFSFGSRTIGMASRQRLPISSSEGNRVVALGTYTGTYKKTGRQISVAYAHVWTVTGENAFEVRPVHGYGEDARGARIAAPLRLSTVSIRLTFHRMAGHRTRHQEQHTMRAIVLEGFGGPDKLVYRDIPEPEPMVGSRRHSDQGLRHQPRRDAHAPRRMGRERRCDRSGVRRHREILPGRRVSGRRQGCGDDGRHGTDDQRQLCRVHAGAGRMSSHSSTSDLPWTELAALPESYATAWTCLFRNLEIEKGQTLLIRGATSAFGQAAVNLAVDAGVKVIATTRSASASRFSKRSASAAARSRHRICRSVSPRRASSIACWIWSATA